MNIWLFFVQSSTYFFVARHLTLSFHLKLYLPLFFSFISVNERTRKKKSFCVPTMIFIQFIQWQIISRNFFHLVCEQISMKSIILNLFCLTVWTVCFVACSMQGRTQNFFRRGPIFFVLIFKYLYFLFLLIFRASEKCWKIF